MKPSEVPDDLMVLVSNLMEEEAHEHCDSEPCPGSTVEYHNGLARHILAAVLPAHERQVRERVAAEILDVPTVRMGRDLVVISAYLNAARIARGES